MDVVVSELEGSFVRFILSVPMDVILFLGVLYISASLSFYLFGNRSQPAIILTLVVSLTLFGGYYLYLRPSLLDSPVLCLVFMLFVAAGALSAPALVARNQARAFKLIKLILVAGFRRVLESAIALIALFAFLPLVILISAFIKLTIGGTVFVKEPSSSHSGKSIMLYSFRTRIPYRYSYISNVFLMSSEKDWRFTRFGRFLHKSSLRLIPRLFNVLNGDLHLIGMSPLKTRVLISAFSKELLRRERELVAKLYDVKEAKAFPFLMDYYIPTGAITYSDLNAYKLQPATRTVLKFLDIRPRLSEEAVYFTSKPFPSLRLFVLLFATFAIRLLTAFNLLRLEEISERPGVKKEAV